MSHLEHGIIFLHFRKITVKLSKTFRLRLRSRVDRSIRLGVNVFQNSVELRERREIGLGIWRRSDRELDLILLERKMESLLCI